MISNEDIETLQVKYFMKFQLFMKLLYSLIFSKHEAIAGFNDNIFATSPLSISSSCFTFFSSCII